MQKNKLLKFFSYFLLSLLFLAPSLLQFKIDTTFTRPQFNDEARYLPSGKFLKGAALGYDEVLADLLWIKAIGYFGEHFDTDKDYTWLAHILDLITTLDPNFEEVYELGGVIFTTELQNIDSSIKILQKGMDNVPRHHPRYWYLPFFTAFNYMYYKGDYQTAAKYLEQAASFPKSPAYLPLLVGRLYANTDDPGLALPFLEEMLDKTATPEMKESLEKRIKDIQIKQHTQFLSKACIHFQERTGRYPEHLEELAGVEPGKALPVEPYGGQYQITEKCTVLSTSNADSMELHMKKKEKQPLIFLKEQK